MGDSAYYKLDPNGDVIFICKIRTRRFQSGPKKTISISYAPALLPFLFPTSGSHSPTSGSIGIFL